MPIHAGLKDHTTPGPAPHQLNKLLRTEVIDASPFQKPSLRVEHAEDAVAFVVVDANEAGPLLYDRLCSHPTFYTLDFMRLRGPAYPHIKQPSAFHVA